MRAEDWIELLKKLPPDEHDHLLVATTQGVEIAIQQVFQINENYVLVRGRMGGTTDAGRVYCLPYDGLVYMGLTRPMNDVRVQELFGPLLLPPRVDLTAAASEPEPATAAEPTPTAPVDVPAPLKQSAAASLRERLRQRVGAGPRAEGPLPAPTPTPTTPVPAAPAAAAGGDSAKNAALSLRERLRARFGSSGSSPGVDKPKSS